MFEMLAAAKKAAPTAPWPTDCPWINDVIGAVIAWLI